MSGSIPPELGNLTNLQYLVLGGNRLSGPIPPELGNLTNLQSLSLFSNQLSGPIPPELGNLTNLQSLSLFSNQLSGPIPPELGNLTNLTRLDIYDNQLSGQIPSGDFDIELVFLDDHFTEPQKQVIRYAARRWMSIIREDLPDYTFSQGWSGECGGQSFAIPSGERIDDLRIYVSVRELDDVSVYIGGVEELIKPAAQASPRVARETYLSVVGCMEFDVSWGTFNSLLSIALHEIGHVLGIGTVWNESGFLQDSSDDPHFNGPLAIAAFDNAGGRDYTGAKVPIENDGGHWRTPVLTNELMSLGDSNDRLSAITIQSLADLGYVVDVTQADPYTLPDAAAAKVAAFPKDHSAEWLGSRGVDIGLQDDHLMRRLGLHPQSEPRPVCGFGTEREPIYVVDPQGRIIRTLSH